MRGIREQVIRTQPSRKFTESYLTKKGLRLHSEGVEDVRKYTKNRYEINPDSKIFRHKNKKVKRILHFV
jgi:hypothetical protein